MKQWNEIETAPPTAKEAEERFQAALKDVADTSPTPEEIENLRAQCRAGGTIFYRCTFESISDYLRNGGSTEPPPR